METEVLIGYVAAVLVGLTLGLTGSGGSILTVPIMVYLMRVNPVSATGYSLFIVGSTSLVGSATYFKQQLVDIRTGLIFGLPSIISIYLTRSFLIPVIPVEVFHIGDWVLTRDILLMLLFAMLMVLASVSMIRRRSVTKATGVKQASVSAGVYPVVMMQGAAVGLLTGLVGAGGGFLIVPALIFLLGLPVKKAIGTSLFIIAINALAGFAGEMSRGIIDWGLILLFTALSIAGIVLGNRLARKIDGQKLKQGFGWFVLAIGLYIIVKELFIT